MKNSKMNLNDLKVKSFITSIEKGDSFTLKGGSDITCHPTNCENTGTVTTSVPTGGGHTVTQVTACAPCNTGNNTGSGTSSDPSGTTGPDPHGDGG